MRAYFLKWYIYVNAGITCIFAQSNKECVGLSAHWRHFKHITQGLQQCHMKCVAPI